MNADRAIVAAHLLPFERVGEAIRAFWPVVVTNMLMIFTPGFAAPAGLTDPYTSETAPEGAFAVLLVFPALLYFGLVAARGAIAWHRSLIRGEAVPWTPPWPDGLTWRYFGWALLVGLASGIVGAISGGIVGWAAVALFGADPPNVTAPIEPTGYTPFSLGFSLAIALVAGAVFALLASWFLKLPAVAVERDRPRADARARWLLFGTTVPWVLASSLLTLPFPPTPPLAVAVLLLALNVYAATLAVTALSLAFRSSEGTL